MDHLRIDWGQVQEEISRGDHSSVRILKEAYNTAAKLLSDHQAKVREQEKLQRIGVLKALKPQTKVYYRGSYPELVGRAGYKVRNGRAYMRVAFGSDVWRIPYSDIQIEPLTEPELTSRKIGAAIAKMLRA